MKSSSELQHRSSQHAVLWQAMDGGALWAVAWGLFERVKHLLGWTTVTGGTRGGAALCKQPLMAKPLSGLMISCVLSVSAAPRVAVPGASFYRHVSAEARPSPSELSFVSVLSAEDRIYSSCTFFFFCFVSLLLQFLSGRFQHPSFLHQPSPPPSSSFRSFPLCSTLSFLFLPLPPSLSPPSPSLRGDWLGNLAGCQ